MHATRRGLLAGVAAAAVGGLAGCAGSGGDAGAAGRDGTARLAFVRLVNQHSSAHTVHVLVQRGDEPVHWSSHELAASGAGGGGAGDETATTLDQTWSDDSGAFTVFVRLDDADDWTEFDVGDGSVDCYGVETRITTAGEVESLFAKNPGDCGTSTPTGTA